MKTVMKIFVLLLMGVTILVGILTMVNVDQMVQVSTTKGNISSVLENIDYHNRLTQEIEKKWIEIEENDTSAIRAQVYLLQAIWARLQNIDRTMEDGISACHIEASSLIDTLNITNHLLFYLVVMAGVLIIFVSISIVLLMFTVS